MAEHSTDVIDVTVTVLAGKASAMVGVEPMSNTTRVLGLQSAPAVSCGWRTMDVPTPALDQADVTRKRGRLEGVEVDMAR